MAVDEIPDFWDVDYLERQTKDVNVLYGRVSSIRFVTEQCRFLRLGGRLTCLGSPSL